MQIKLHKKGGKPYVIDNRQHESPWLLYLGVLDRPKYWQRIDKNATKSLKGKGSTKIQQTYRLNIGRELANFNIINQMNRSRTKYWPILLIL